MICQRWRRWGPGDLRRGRRRRRRLEPQAGGEGISWRRGLRGGSDPHGRIDKVPVEQRGSCRDILGGICHRRRRVGVRRVHGSGHGGRQVRKDWERRPVSGVRHERRGVCASGHDKGVEGPLDAVHPVVDAAGVLRQLKHEAPQREELLTVGPVGHGRRGSWCGVRNSE